MNVAPAQAYPTWAWVTFVVVLGATLLIDFFAHRGGRETTRRAAIAWSVAWVGVGLSFGAFVWVKFGTQAGGEYLAAYLIEKSLSLDNLFVFLVVFRSLKIAPDQQHRVLLWGIFGALVFRALFVLAGVAALERWSWLEYVFGGLLLWAAWRTMREDPAAHRGDSRAVAWLSKHLPFTEDLHGGRFFAREGGRWVATRLFVAVGAVELTDILFAVDSVPAALAVTHQPFLVYSSNAFAILGLRALYLVLAQIISELRYLHVGLSLVLAFAAIKMIASHWLAIPPWLSVLIIVTMIGASAWISLRVRRQAREAQRRSVGP